MSGLNRSWSHEGMGAGTGLSLVSIDLGLLAWLKKGGYSDIISIPLCLCGDGMYLVIGIERSVLNIFAPKIDRVSLHSFTSLVCIRWVWIVVQNFTSMMMFFLLFHVIQIFGKRTHTLVILVIWCLGAGISIFSSSYAAAFFFWPLFNSTIRVIIIWGPGAFLLL